MHSRHQSRRLAGLHTLGSHEQRPLTPTSKHLPCRRMLAERTLRYTDHRMTAAVVNIQMPPEPRFSVLIQMNVTVDHDGAESRRHLRQHIDDTRQLALKETSGHIRTHTRNLADPCLRRIASAPFRRHDTSRTRRVPRIVHVHDGDRLRVLRLNHCFRSSAGSSW